MFFEPKACWQHIDLSERRTAIELAEEMGKLVDVHYPEAEKKITVVLDNLNTYTLAVLREAFEPQEARRIARKLEFHCTPKRASRLNQAEVEFSVLCGECMGRAHPRRRHVKKGARSVGARMQREGSNGGVAL